METNPFLDDAIAFLPELQSIIMSDNTCYELVERDALVVHIVDTEWGRPFWLFDKIERRSVARYILGQVVVHVAKAKL